MVCTCSLVERLDLLPIAVLLKTLGTLPARWAASAHLRLACTTCCVICKQREVVLYAKRGTENRRKQGTFTLFHVTSIDMKQGNQ